MLIIKYMTLYVYDVPRAPAPPPVEMGYILKELGGNFIAAISWPRNLPKTFRDGFFAGGAAGVFGRELGARPRFKMKLSSLILVY